MQTNSVIFAGIFIGWVIFAVNRGDMPKIITLLRGGGKVDATKGGGGQTAMGQSVGAGINNLANAATQAAKAYNSFSTQSGAASQTAYPDLYGGPNAAQTTAPAVDNALLPSLQ